MARDNPTWGAPRVADEPGKLGIEVSQRIVTRYLPQQPPPPGCVQRWPSFRRNHRDAIAAADCFTVPTATFQALYVYFVIHHDRRRLLNDSASYYAEDRTHLGLDGDTQGRRAVDRRPGPDPVVVAEPRVGGLDHRYRWKQAA